MMGDALIPRGTPIPGAEPPPADADLIQRFAPVFEQLRATAADRDRKRAHPFEEVQELQRLGFGALRVPRALGGHGASLRQLFRMLVELAAVESNLPQALRHHFFQVETVLLRPDTPERQVWIDRIVRGEIFGNGTTEPQGAKLGRVETRLTRHGDGFRLSGKKIYSTGNLYADWIPIFAVDENDEPVYVVVSAKSPGVNILNDWDGFGQRLTGTDTTIYTDVEVAAANITRGVRPGHHGAGFHQLVLVAVLAGIGRAVRDDLVADVQRRKRIYYTGTGELPRHDAIIQESVGSIEARVTSCVVLADHAAGMLQEAWDLWAAGADAAIVDQAFIAAEIVIGKAQVVLSREVVDIAGRLFDGLGASSTLRSWNLDRHWRNARTVASHNSALFKARVVGDYVLNGTPPVIFRVGQDVGEKPEASEA